MTLTVLLIRIAIVAILLTGLNYLLTKKKPEWAEIKNWGLTYLQNFAGALFVFSGYVKAVDPKGTAYKMEQYFGEFKTPIGVVETIKEGKDITLVSYGSTLRMVKKAAKELLEVGIDAEVIDVQSLLPFDIDHNISKSVAKTNRLMVIDEDVPGGASAYILDKIINKQDAYQYLDSKPLTLTANPHRPAYGTDGDYFSKPSLEDIFEAVYNVMSEVSPNDFPILR